MRVALVCSIVFNKPLDVQHVLPRLRNNDCNTLRFELTTSFLFFPVLLNALEEHRSQNTTWLWLFPPGIGRHLCSQFSVPAVFFFFFKAETFNFSAYCWFFSPQAFLFLTFSLFSTRTVWCNVGGLQLSRLIWLCCNHMRSVWLCFQICWNAANKKSVLFSYCNFFVTLFIFDIWNIFFVQI